MSNAYKQIFSAEVLHTYFDNDICRCLRFQPSDETLALGKRGFHMRSKVNGFDLYFSNSATLADTLSYITHTTGLTYFEFLAATTDSDFNLFTEIPAGWVGQLLFDSSSAENSYQDHSVALAQNLHAADNDRYVISLRIYFTDVLKYCTAAELFTFEMKLSARATQWQYYIINRSSTPLENLSISGKSDVSFDGPQTVTVQSGQQALLFTSGSNLLPLSFAPKYKFDLVSNPQNADQPARKTSSKVLFKGLPNADPKNIGIVRVEGKAQVSSPIYVYV
jgi:hypothetical protein